MNQIKIIVALYRIWEGVGIIRGGESDSTSQCGYSIGGVGVVKRAVLQQGDEGYRDL